MKLSTQVKILNTFNIFNWLRSFVYKFDTYNKDILHFYKLFVKPGDLCFDIGANVGRKTDIFLKLGAKVIAVEPQPEYAQFLKNKFKNKSDVIIVDSAIDMAEGTKQLYIY